MASHRRPVGDAAGGHLRGQRRPRQQPLAGHGRRRRRVRQPELHPARRDRRPARRCVQHGRRRVHLDAEPARAVRAPDRPRAGRDGGDARGGGGRAGRRPIGPRASPPDEAARIAHRIFRGPGRRPSTCSSARSSGSTRTSSARRGAPRPARSSRSRSARPSRSSRTCSVAGPRSCWSASALSLVALFAVGAAVSLLTGRGLIFSGFRQLGIGLAAAARDLRRSARSSASRRGLSGAEPDARSQRAASRRGPRPRAGWSNGPGDRYAAHDHGYDKVIVVERGSIRFGLPATGLRARRSTWPRATGSSCRPGPRHDAIVGPAGVACLEAHRPAGTLDRVARRAAGTLVTAHSALRGRLSPRGGKSDGRAGDVCA